MRNTLSSRVTEELFKRIVAILGSRFSEAYKGVAPEVFQAEWSASLADFKPIEIERGLAQMAQQKFVPTLGEFSQWCRPCLDPEYAFHEAVRCFRQRDKGMVGDWSHPAVWRAASTMSLEVRQQDYRKVAARWRLELSAELAVGWGDAVPEPPLRIENRVVATNDSPAALAAREKIKKMLAEMRAPKPEPKEVDDGAS